jgi:hypothetical protein
MASFNPDHRGVGNMLQSEFMERTMVRVAEEIKGRAEAMAPVGHSPGDKHPGRYKASFHIRSHRHGGAPGRYGARRAEAIVYNDAPEAVFVEYGARSKEGERVLARAAFRRA